MSAIAGVAGSEDQEAVQRMLREMQHRGAEEQPTVYAAKGGVIGSIGHHIEPSPNSVSEDFRAGVLDGRPRKKVGQPIASVPVTLPDIAAGLRGSGPKWITGLTGGYAFLLLSDNGITAVCDPFGLKPLYVGYRHGVTYYASEIKALVSLTNDIDYVKPGTCLNPSGEEQPFASVLPGDDGNEITPEQAACSLRHALIEVVKHRAEGAGRVGIFLSGGIDSSAIAAAAVAAGIPVETFAVGDKDSEDVAMAQKVAVHLGTEHHTLTYNLATIERVLRRVIYYLESYDKYLVRSSVANYLVSQLASEAGMDTVFCGEGGDELLAGYSYLKEMPAEKAENELRQLLETGHANGFQRVDRMTMAHSLHCEVPFMDSDVVDLSFSLPLDVKLRRRKDAKQQITEKWILRRAFAGDLPEEVTWRPKAKFFQGSRSEHACSKLASKLSGSVPDQSPQVDLRDEEEKLYFSIFQEFFPVEAARTVGVTRTQA